ncbi:MAG: dockerin type I repeat-containing protein [Flavobacteriales bacterium]|nr:dockerin type I repeat-containing protein [Flavobacteriales bacterium]
MRLILVTFTLLITASFPAQFIINDECESAIDLVAGSVESGTLCNAAADPVDLCTPNGETPYGTWYHFNSGACEEVSFELLNPDETPMALTIFLSTSGMGCEDKVELACCPLITGTCAASISTLATIPPNTDLYFFVHNYDPETCGNYSLEVTCGVLGCTDPFNCNYDPEATVDDGSCTFECTCAEGNTTCANAYSLYPGFSHSISMYCLTDYYFPAVLSECLIPSHEGVWYKFTGSGSEVVLSTCGTEGTSFINILTAEGNSCDGAMSIAVDAATQTGLCSLLYPCDVNDTEIVFTAEAGQVYYVYVGATSLTFVEFSFDEIVQVAGDYNGDGVVDTVDLLMLLGTIGCDVDCATDLNDDSMVNVADLLLFLSYFGNAG